MVEYRVGIDVGGTFTDIVGLHNGHLFRRKVRSTTADFSAGVLDSLQILLTEVGGAGRDVKEIIHGTTLVTNAIIEKRGARTGLITTRGFRDVLEIARLRTPRLYDLAWRKPRPLVERELRREADERVMFDGTVLKPLDEESVRRATDLLVKKGVTSIAICFINSFAEPAHERLAAEVVRAMAPDISLSVSHEVLPEMREYERTSTTVINAYVRPLVDGYLEGMERGLSAMCVEAPLLIMQSNGGLMGSGFSREKPIYMVESGPAAGVMGSLQLGRRLGHAEIISFDMGGTTAKAATIQLSEPDRHVEYEVGGELHMGHHLLRGDGYLIRVPSIGIAEVGAGGGSVVWIDEGGVLQVGPQSAGAQPGPACYGTGGVEPTITDANVILGYLNPAYLVGGGLPLCSEAANQVFEQKIASPMGIGVTESAYGAYLVANSRMIRAVRAVTTEKGHDPADFVLYAFGGCGPAHAAEMAKQLGVKKIVVPPVPGLFSSLGLLLSDVEHHYVRTFWCILPGGIDYDEANVTLTSMKKEALASLLREGFAEDHVHLAWQADMRYDGQGYELPVTVPAGKLSSQSVVELVEGFHLQHQRTFGYRSEEKVQLVNFRLIARGIPIEPRVPASLELEPSRLASTSRDAYFGPSIGWMETPVIARETLDLKLRSGPLIVEEYDATTVVPPQAGARLDELGNILITTEEQ